MLPNSPPICEPDVSSGAAAAAPEPGPVTALLGRALAAGTFPGAAAAWGRRGQAPRTAALGTLSVGPVAAAASPDAWYDLASLTKPLVVTTLCLLAVDRGEIDLDTRVSEVLAAADGRPIGEATVQQLLAHTSGLPAWRPLYALAGEGPQAALGAILELSLELPPGQRTIYSCLDFILLGAVLERVARASLASLLSSRVLQPLALQDRLGFLPDPLARPIAGGAREPSAERRMVAEAGLDVASVPAVAPAQPDDGNARFLGGVAGNAGLFGTAPGVWSLASEYLPGGGRLLGARQVELATRPWAAGEGEVRGLGWQVASAPGCSAGPALHGDAVGHTGFTGTSVWVDPQHDAVFVLLANRNHPGHRGTDLHPLRRRFHALAVHDLEDVSPD